MKALLIEDNPDHCMLIQDAFYEAFSEKATLLTENNLQAGLEQLSHESFDVCLFDLTLPDSRYEQTIKTIKDFNTPVPIVVMTALDDISVASSLVLDGVQDYMLKSEITASQVFRAVYYAIERKQQLQLLEEKNADMQMFCYSLSHDFKGSLNRIKIMLDFLQSDLSDRITLTPEELKNFRNAKNGAKSVMSLINGLHHFLSISEISNDSKVVDLEELLLQVEASIQDSKEPKLTLRYSHLPKIEGLSSQLFLVFQNLIQNVIKHNDRPPEIDISSSTDPDKNTCTIYFKDNGRGIDEKHSETIFKPFSRISADTQGSGLGLSIVKRILEKHGGGISFESEINVGSCFKVTLPITQKAKN